MQASAPALFNVPQDAVWRNFSGGVGLLAGGLLTIWLADRLAWSWPIAGGLACLIGPFGGLFALRVLRPATGALRWDGTSWWWMHAEPESGALMGAEAVLGRTTVALDAGRWMLLRFKAQGGSVFWLPVSSAASARDTWHSLRALLYSRRSLRAAPEVVEEAVR